MLSIEINGVKKGWIRWSVVAFGIAGATVFALHSDVIRENMSAYLVRKPVTTYQWVVLSQQQISSGAVIPPDTNVVFHLPATFTTITRETLLGQKGEDVRYWGYCFPENDPAPVVDARTGFPGLLFLSEKEREVRAAQAALNAVKFSPSTNIPTTSSEADAINNPTKSAIRHQLEVFKPNTMCYIMSDHALSIGLDPDNDRLNDALENEIGTDPHAPDTDGDGVGDGVEYLNFMNPLIRDTDNDGIIDGIEDANWDGRTEIGETNPRNKDTDRDGICDGMCRMHLQKQDLYIGEDKNLNGVVDAGETDPRKYSTKNDGISDQIGYMQCVASGKTSCP